MGNGKQFSQCLKITEKVAFNSASEASYVYILSGQKFINNVKNGPFWRVLRKPEACGQTVLPDRSLVIGQKIGGKCQNLKFQMLHVRRFSKIVPIILFIFVGLEGNHFKGKYSMKRSTP